MEPPSTSTTTVPPPLPLCPCASASYPPASCDATQTAVASV
uniref:Uncharacterized protein n=1 Tax=Arundo donax TaxID=35708 RepID=A0A0A9DLC3_ARUDO